MEALIDYMVVQDLLYIFLINLFVKYGYVKCPTVFCPHNMANFGLLTAEMCWRVWGTAANFNGFHVLGSLLHRHRSTEANQTLHDVWLSPGLVHYIYWGLLPPNGILPAAKFTLRPIKSCVLLYWQLYRTARQQWASAKLCSVEQREPPIFRRASITLGIGPHSSSCKHFDNNSSTIMWL